jgi:hypothetical protein
MREWQVATLTAGSTVLTEAEITDFRASRLLPTSQREFRFVITYRHPY